MLNHECSPIWIRRIRRAFLICQGGPGLQAAESEAAEWAESGRRRFDVRGAVLSYWKALFRRRSRPAEVRSVKNLSRLRGVGDAPCDLRAPPRRWARAASIRRGSKASIARDKGRTERRMLASPAWRRERTLCWQPRSPVLRSLSARATTCTSSAGPIGRGCGRLRRCGGRRELRSRRRSVRDDIAGSSVAGAHRRPFLSRLACGCAIAHRPVGSGRWLDRTEPQLFDLAQPRRRSRVTLECTTPVRGCSSVTSPDRKAQRCSS